MPNHRLGQDHALDAEDLHEAVSYRAGMLMGRRLALTNISDLLASNGRSSASDVRAAVAEWCAQTEHELDVELVLLVREHGHDQS